MDVGRGFLSAAGVQVVRLLSNRDRKVVIACSVVDGLLVVTFICTIMYLWFCRRPRMTRRFLATSPQRRSLVHTRRHDTHIDEPGTSWQFGRAMSKQQLDYVKENCVVDMEEDLKEGEVPCAICLDFFEAKSPRSVLKLDCSHCFHETCMSHWIVESHGGASCPLCKEAIPVAV